MASQIFEPSFTPVSIVDIIYPIGSIYMNISNINPSNVFSGTSWERISDKFLAASGSTFNLGDTGGSSSKTVTASGTISGHELTIQEIPSHNHQLGSHSHDSGTYVVAESGSHKHI